MAIRDYTMKINLSVLDHLGLNLYSSMPAVLSETVANAWDADAQHVAIDIGTTEVTITDDGVGMDYGEVEDKFLTVGYQRRKQGEVTTPELKRHVMGRKGIGKLSLFAVADEIEVWTVKRDENDKIVDRNALMLDADEIRTMAADSGVYKPKALDPSIVTIPKGTRIILRRLKMTPTKGTVDALRRRLARRFSVIGDPHKFEVKVKNAAIGPGDRDYLQKIQFLWSVADDDRYEKLAKNVTKTERISGVIDAAKGWKVEGWIGSLTDRESVEAANNVVVLMSHGKLVQEDLLATVDAGGLFTKYLIGELEADFLDEDGLPDIVTSDRQHLKEDDERYAAITAWFENVLREIGNRWRNWRQDKALDDALAIKVVKDWYGALAPSDQRAAKKLFGRIGTVMKDRPEEERELYRHTILAFERLRLRDALDQIDDLPDDVDVAGYEKVFGGLDEVEKVQYGQIARGRLAIIKKFKDLVPESKEKVIQTYLFKHLWLLHPSWERPTTSVVMEETVTKDLKKVNLTKEEAAGRIDIRYATAAGKHIVVELKKADVTVSVFALAEQLSKYREAMTKTLQQQFHIENPEIELIAVLGTAPSGPADLKEREGVLRPLNARWVTYNQLIDEALGSYQDYLDANERVSKLQSILDKLDEPVTTATSDGGGDGDGDGDGDGAAAGNGDGAAATQSPAPASPPAPVGGGSSG
jgi:hypothetical protein